MGYRAVEGEGLRTSYSASPTVRVSSVEGGPVSVELSFQAEPAPSGAKAKFTILNFESVLEYHWITSSFTYFITNQDDHAYRLIEIIDSGQLEMMARNSAYRSRPKGMRLGGTIREEDVRHFRVAFDDYGTFDILCLGLGISYTVRESGV